MAEKETTHEPKDLVEAVPEEIEKLEEKEIEFEGKEEGAKPEEIKSKKQTFAEMKAQRIAESEKRALESWVPKTNLGRLVKDGKIKSVDEILSRGDKILESEIVDLLLNLKIDLLAIGQAKGKFGGGKRRAWRQTQRKTMEGNVITFSCMAVVGDTKGHIGLGYGKAKETLPARAKAIRQAKLNVIKVNRGYENPQEKAAGNNPHTVPFVVEGKCGSVRIKLIPAPRGTGLVVGSEAKKVLGLAGILDVYGVARGQTRTTFNVAKAIIDALNKTNKLL